MDFNDNRQILMKHYTNPTNKGFNNSESAWKRKLKSDSCSDELTIEIETNNNVIKDIRFEGSACVIATSTSDILFSLLKGKDFKQARKIVDDYNDMIINGSEPSKDLEQLSIFSNVHSQKNRQKCATLGVNGIIEFLNQNNE